MLYGVEIAGVADSLLHFARTAAAHAASAEAGGKNVDRVLYVVDGAAGTIDPGFSAHAVPLKAWAAAWWEQWVPHEALENTFWQARQALRCGSGAAWSKVIGPAGAIILTAERIGWKWHSAAVVTTDDGTTLDATRDPPSVFASAAKAACRRWRFARIAAALPGLVPNTPDV